ncbi:FecR family protein [Thalassospira marina]|uniref:Iron dicitrate transport regulator FecR n=1 Tax=Thalassospira marina TaxID=2048283 RepID=A0A2N3KWR8_9PROT|nr:FecR family protein [Thalassospira marina]PKR55025.1 iron dicitrate transport regulator FecR [Thalassospira marina]
MSIQAQTMPRDHDKLSKEAARWAARLQSSDATAADKAAFREWRDKNPAHEAAYNEFASLWGDLGGVRLPENRLQQIRRGRTLKRAGICGSLLVCLVAFGLYQNGYYDRYHADYYTKTGEITHITLSDGSKIALNSDSAIRVRYAPDHRDIDLLRGEAFFTVAHNADRPFTVHENNLSARAVGTRYGVSTAHGDLPADVQVEEGIVEVTSASDHQLLTAGQAAELDRDGMLNIEKTDIGNETAWRDGKLVFSQKPLRDVLASLEQYRTGRIILLDDDIGNLQLSGIFDIADTDQALRSIAQRLPITFSYATPLLVIAHKK